MIPHIQDVTGISLSDNNVESVFSIYKEINTKTMFVVKPLDDSSSNKKNLT